MLRDFAVDLGWLDIIGEASDGRVAVQMIDELRPDLVFLDVRLPKLTGLQVLQRVEYEPKMVFTTAYERYAAAALSWRHSIISSSRSHVRGSIRQWSECDRG